MCYTLYGSVHGAFLHIILWLEYRAFIVYLFGIFARFKYIMTLNREVAADDPPFENE